jgi:hypothetical protein
MDLGEHDDVRLLDVSDWTSRRDALERAPDTTAP